MIEEVVCLSVPLYAERSDEKDVLQIQANERHQTKGDMILKLRWLLLKKKENVDLVKVHDGVNHHSKP